MGKKSFGLKKMCKDITFRLYFAIIWRYVVWLFMLNFLGFVFYNLLLMLFFSFMLEHRIFVETVVGFFHFFLFHIMAFVLAMESVMKVGFKSGHYKLMVENCRSKKKKT